MSGSVSVSIIADDTGQIITGHVAAGPKVMLRIRGRREDGATAEALAYPWRVTFDDGEPCTNRYSSYAAAIAGISAAVFGHFVTRALELSHDWVGD